MEKIASVIYRLESEEEVAEFLCQILTPNEQRMISRRWELVRLLGEGLPQRDVAARLGMSLCNVTRGAKELKKPHSIFKRILEKQQ